MVKKLTFFASLFFCSNLITNYLTTEAQKYHSALDDLDPDKVKSQMQTLHKDTQVLRKQLTKVKDDPEAATRTDLKSISDP